MLTLYRMHFFCFQMCNRLPEIMKNGEAGIFPVYYSLKEPFFLATFFSFVFTSINVNVCVYMFCMAGGEGIRQVSVRRSLGEHHPTEQWHRSLPPTSRKVSRRHADVSFRFCFGS